MTEQHLPSGPLPKAVYVRRRLIVLGGLLAILLAAGGLVWLFFAAPGAGGAATAEKVELPSEIKAADAPTPAAEIATCATGDLRVKPLVDHDSYAADELPQLSLQLKYTGEKECQADLGTAGIIFTISSGADEVWRSTDCQVSPDHRAVILQPGQKLKTEAIEWDRTRSSTKTCKVDRDPVGADGATYHLHAAIAGATSTETARFMLY